MKKCLDDAGLQSFFDRELPSEVMEEVARHLASCASCAQAASEVERENRLFVTALEPEMSAAVPTEQLHARITAAVAELSSSAPARAERTRWSQAFTNFFEFTPQRAAVFASILAILVLGSILVAIGLKSRSNQSTSQKTPPLSAPTEPAKDQLVTVTPVPTAANVASYKPKQPLQRHRSGTVALPQREDQVAGVQLIPGEKSYLRTIAELDAGMKQNHRQTITPAARGEYERNLKLVDYAIAATRSKAKRSPNDPDAAEFMFAAYQSKINLLSTVSEARLAQH
jgi:hypothetical protein